MFVNGLSGAAVGRRAPQPKTSKPLPASEAQAPASANADTADDFDRCIADVFESEPSGALMAKEIRAVVQAWFTKQNLGKPVEVLWAKMRETFKHDANNGRPRYIGLKPRAKGPPRLTVVTGQG